MKRKQIKKLLFHVLVGQVVAFLNSITGVSTTKLVNNNASYPLLQSVTSYSFIFAVYAPLFIYFYLQNRQRRFSNFTFLDKPWKYAILGLIDMEANFVIVKAYQYTDIVSVQLLGCFSIPCVLVLSYFILKMRFSISHVIGCIIATGGLAILVVLDADGVTRDTMGPNVAKGDLFCLLAAALYATSNVLTEFFIKPKSKPIQNNEEEILREAQEVQNNNNNSEITNGVLSPNGCQEVEEFRESVNMTNTNFTSESQHDSERQQSSVEHEEILVEVPKYIPLMENLCCMSGCALTFATIQFFAVEWKTFSPVRASWTNEDWLFQMIFGITMLCVYTCLPILFIIASAAFANISLLAVSVYSIIWNVTIFDVHPTPVFFASYVVIIVGILIYDLSDIPWSWCPRINYPCGDPRDVVILNETQPSVREEDEIHEVPQEVTVYTSNSMENMHREPIKMDKISNN